MSKLGGGRMPRVGSNVVDERATRMIHDWIARMPSGTAVASMANVPGGAAEEREAIESLRKADQLSPSARAAAIGRLTSSTRGALMLLGMIDRGQASQALRRDVVASRAEQSARRGSRPVRAVRSGKRASQATGGCGRPRGDPGSPRRRRARGRLIFATNAAAQCKNCHKAGDVGETVGPDLTKIGAKYNKPALLDQILEPSKTIEPQYTTFLLETKDGRVLSGLAVERNKEAVVLKDAQGKTIKVASADIERLVPQSRSLMPELLLRDLTAQQVADLLEFLGSLR